MVIHVADKYDLFTYGRKIQADVGDPELLSCLRSDRQVLE